MKTDLELLKKTLYAGLPHGLKIQSRQNGICELSVSSQTVTSLKKFNCEQVIDLDLKPILHPLSDLTKPIIHKGKEIVVASLLWSIPASEEHDFEVYGTIPEYWEIGIKALKQRCMEYRDFEILAEFHFNFLNIPEKLYVNVNTLEENPYK